MNAHQRQCLITSYMAQAQPGYGFLPRKTKIRNRVTTICKISMLLMLSFILGYGFMEWLNT